MGLGEAGMLREMPTPVHVSKPQPHLAQNHNRWETVVLPDGEPAAGAGTGTRNKNPSFYANVPQK